ncbi:MAG TPA: protein translocase subunit SecD [Myxococcales bacterium]|nr:protein translocase subunit SecD [Myxococcales bacterium]
MDRVFYWKVGLITAVVLISGWLLVPTFYYFKLPPDERNQPEKLEAMLPSWAPGAKTRLNLGLDLQGGIHLVLGVDTDTALKAKVSRRGDEIVEYAREKGVKEPRAKAEGMKVVFSAAGPEDLDKLRKLVLKDFDDMHPVGSDDGTFAVSYKEQVVGNLKSEAVSQALKVIANRVDRWGVTEPVIQKRGDNAILVQLPGFKDPARAKDLLGKTAQLEFKIVDDEGTYFQELYEKLKKDLPEGITVQTETEGGRARDYLMVRGAKVALDYERAEGPGGTVLTPPYLTATGDNGRAALEQLVEAGGVAMPEERELGLECIPSKLKRNSCEGYRTYLLKSKTELTGDSVVDARALMDQSPGAGGRPYVSLSFDPSGARDFERITGDNVRRRMAIVLDQTVNSAPVIQSKIAGGRAQITLGSLKPYQELVDEANDLALVLKAGALPAPVTIGEERTVGATLGPELIRNGSLAVAVGVVLVLIFMVVIYKYSGLVADVALVLNALLIVAAMAAFNATLTLPGIAGFVLSLGMSVDANVLINERIREELRLGKTPRAALEAGYGRAFWTIFDSNLTTLIAGFVLLNYGSGPVRGFAVMLIVGILASMFTAIFVTRVIMDWLLIGRGWNKISV